MKKHSFRSKYNILKNNNNKLRHKIKLLNSIEREANIKICFLERKVKELKINNKIIKCTLVAAVLLIILQGVI